MRKSKKIRNEEKRFLRLCSKPYRDMVQGKKQMQVNDFEKICYVLTRLDMLDYMMFFAFRYKGLMFQSIEEMDRHDEEYAKWYSLEDNRYAKMDKCQCWLEEFWKQMPLERQRKKYRDLFWIDFNANHYADVV